MTKLGRKNFGGGFSLVETVVALGLVSFSVLATIGLLSIGGDTGKKAKDESSAARLTENEFERLRSLTVASSFWSAVPLTYQARYFDIALNDLGTNRTSAISNGAIYELHISFIEAPSASNPNPSPTPPVGTADLVANAEVRYPVNAAATNQNVYRFTTLMNRP
jgi:uncharacterized protein (TIGR02598 family)